MTDIRVAEVLAALSLTTDLASGLPFEKGLRVCLVAVSLADRLGLEPEARSARTPPAPAARSAGRSPRASTPARAR